MPETTPAPGARVVRQGAAPSDYGTYGCVVRDKGGVYYLLTAGHVLVGAGSSTGDAVVSGGKVIAHLVDWFPRDPGDASIDAAVARLTVQEPPPQFHIPTIGRPVGDTVDLQPGDPVFMYGATSGFQKGFVADLLHDETFDEVELPPHGTSSIRFTRLVLCTPFTNRGDSGAAVFDRRRRIVGLHVGGSASSSFFCRISPICRQFNVTVFTGA